MNSDTFKPVPGPAMCHRSVTDKAQPRVAPEGVSQGGQGGTSQGTRMGHIPLFPHRYPHPPVYTHPATPGTHPQATTAGTTGLTVLLVLAAVLSTLCVSSGRGPVRVAQPGVSQIGHILSILPVGPYPLIWTRAA